jgi:hypothetical protein
MLVGEQLPQHDHITNLLKKKAKEEEIRVIQKHATLPGTSNKAMVNEIAHSILSSSLSNALYSMSTTNALKLALYREKEKLNPLPPLPETYQDVMKAVILLPCPTLQIAQSFSSSTPGSMTWSWSP